MNTAYAEKRKPDIRKWSEVTARFSTVRKDFFINTSMYVPEDRLFLFAYEREDGEYEVRDIPLLLLNDEGETQYEDAVVFLDSLGKLREIRIALPSESYRKLLNQSADTIDHRNRRHILDFIENLQMAYITKDLDTIRLVFCEQGLIMDEGRFKEKDGLSIYQKQVPDYDSSPEEYLKYLAHLFNENHSFHVSFDKLQIQRHPLKTNFYGVNILNSYTSSTTSDQGYVFFLVEARDYTSPIIHIRIWQPKSSTTENSVIDIGNFQVF